MKVEVAVPGSPFEIVHNVLSLWTQNSINLKKVLAVREGEGVTGSVS